MDENYNLENLAKILKATGKYKVLRKVEKNQAIKEFKKSDYDSVAIILDVETTGLDFLDCEVIELAMIKVGYKTTENSLDILETFSRFRQPSKDIPDEIISLTGIDASMVAGATIDEKSLNAFVEDSDFIIAHNAAFDRKFVEKLWGIFKRKPWLCSLKDINWRDEGLSSATLSAILNFYEFFTDGAHRAIEDCYMLLAILTQRLPSSGEMVIKKLLSEANKMTYRIYAENSPFEMKDVLKKRGYYWSNGTGGLPKAWWKDFREADRDAELKFLKTEIYKREVEIICKEISPLDRYSIRA